MPSEAPHRNLWPLGIIVAFAIFITGTAGLIILAWSQKSDLVGRDYYEQEVKYQAQIDRAERAQRLESKASVAYDAVRQCLTLILPPGHARQEVVGRIHLYRPSAAGLDRQLKLELDSRGVQTLDARGLLPGLWKVRVSWKVEDQEYYLDQSVVVGSKPS